MSKADVEYNRIIKKISEEGMWDKDQDVRTVWADGTKAYTKSIISEKMRFDNSEVPILTSKFVAWKTSIKETLWMWQKKSNTVQDLRDVGVKIWNEWELKDGSIGKAYAYQLRQKTRNLNEVNVDQVDYLLHQLKNNPSSRRLVTEIWIPKDLDEMALPPCVHLTQWYVREGKLHLEVRARSNDMALGNPFNVFQYNVLQRMIAQVTEYELGEYVFNIGDCHYYERHEKELLEQTNLPTYDSPKLWINPEVKDFYDFTIDDFMLIDYKHGEKINYEVAI